MNDERQNCLVCGKTVEPYQLLVGNANSGYCHRTCYLLAEKELPTSKAASVDYQTENAAYKKAVSVQ